MLKAVDQSLEALGAENHQAMIVCHNEEDHPHAHIVVNLVSPEDGRNLSLHADYNKLEDWALAYRRSRNEEHLYVPSREEKAQAKEARKAAVEAHLADCEAKGIEPDLKQNFGIDFVRGQDSVPRHMLKDYKRAARKDPEAANRVLDQQRQLDKDLAQSSILEREGRAKELDKLQSDLTAKLGGIDKKADSAFARSKAQIDKKFDAKRADLASQHYQERTEFEQREERLAGKIQNAVTAIVNRRETDPDSRGIFGAAFNFLTDTKARFDALDKLQRIDRRKLNKSKREESLKFGAINPEWLNKYQQWMESNDKSQNTISIYIRCLRKIINLAIGEGIVHQELYPFGEKKYVVPASENVKKALTLDQVGQIFKYVPKSPGES